MRTRPASLLLRMSRRRHQLLVEEAARRQITLGRYLDLRVFAPDELDDLAHPADPVTWHVTPPEVRRETGYLWFLRHESKAEVQRRAQEAGLSVQKFLELTVFGQVVADAPRGRRPRAGRGGA